MPETYNATRKSAYSPDDLWQEFLSLQRQCRTSVDTILGRSTANGRALEEIPCTSAGRALLDDASASAQRTTLGLGTAAVEAYTEGTFTPGISFGGGTTGITYSTQQGSYERIGKNVHVRFRVVLTSNGSSSGAVLITGLPFTIWNNAAANAVGSVNYSALAGLTDGVICYTSINTTTLALAYGGAAATTQLTEANVTDTADIAGSITYRTA